MISNSSSMDSNIKVLICTTNVGNAEPTEESFNAWIPDDGNVAEVVKDPNARGRFTLIVIGMQEASFECETSSSSSSSSSESIASESETEGEDGEEGAPKEKKSKRKKIKRRLSNVAEAGKDAAKEVKQGLIKGADSVETALTNVSNQIRSIAGSQNHRKSPALFRVLTTGEDNDMEAAQKYGGDTKRLFRLIQARCPSYKFVVNFLRGQMRLIVLVRDVYEDQISDVECKAENTGLGQVLANKGGILTTLTMRGTRLCFMSAHLAAHEGEEYYKARNASFVQILGETKVGPKPHYFDATLYNHHSFICGDLNYRIKLPGIQKEIRSDQEADNSKQDEDDSKKAQKKKEHELHVKRVLQLVQEQDWETLNECDELSNALRKRDCLAGFQTPYCDFPPTFKMLREPGFQYTTQRTPSYTDRILWKSLDGLDRDVKNLAYHPCPDFITSDHKPVRGAFEIKPCNTLSPKLIGTKENLEFNQNTTGKSYHLFISKIKCHDLVMSKSGDPYVLFLTNPRELLVQKEKKGYNVMEKPLYKSSWPKTKTINSSLNPDWGDTEIRLELSDAFDSPSKLKGAFLYLSVYDDDPGSDDLIGTMELNLMKLATPNDDDDEEPLDTVQIYKRPIVKYGKIRGYLSCQITGWWFDRTVPMDIVPQDALVKKEESIRLKKLEKKKSREQIPVPTQEKSTQKTKCNCAIM